MTKDTREYIIYATDTDGSERKAATIEAKSEGHARKIARESHGVKRITDVVEKNKPHTDGYKTAHNWGRNEPLHILEQKADLFFYERQFG